MLTLPAKYKHSMFLIVIECHSSVGLSWVFAENSRAGWWLGGTEVAFHSLVWLNVVSAPRHIPVKSHGWSCFGQPEPYLRLGLNIMFIRAAEVLIRKSAPRALHTRGLALELPPQSIPSLTKGQYLPLFSTLVLWNLRDFKMRDIFKLYKEICS